MAENLNYNFFPLKNEVNENDAYREGSLILEYFQVAVTIGTNTGDVEIPTELDEVLMVIPGGYSSVFAAGDAVTNMTTDGVITTGAVTVRVNSVSIADGSLTVRGFLVGKRKMSAVSVA